MSDIRFEGWLHRSGTGGVYQDSAGNVGIASTQPQTRLDIGNGGFQVGPTGIATVTTVNTTNLIKREVVAPSNTLMPNFVYTESEKNRDRCDANRKIKVYRKDNDGNIIG